MKKEVFFAIFLGFVLGLIITFGIWTANKSLKQANVAVVNPQSSTSATPAASPVPSQPISTLALSFTSPEDESLVSKSTVVVEGKTAPNSVVALYYDLGDQFVSSDSAGKFTATVPLDTGYNFITATAYDDHGNTATKDLTITYTTQKI